MQDKSYQPLRKEKEGSIVKSKASVRSFEYSTNRIMERRTKKREQHEWQLVSFHFEQLSG
jgi:hypothetical protein